MAVLFAASIATAQNEWPEPYNNLEVIEGLPDYVRPDSWYVDCPAYQADSLYLAYIDFIDFNSLLYRKFWMEYHFPEDPSEIVATPHKIKEPGCISGIAMMVRGISDKIFDTIQPQALNLTKMDEEVQLYVADPTATPYGIRLVKSVRWDTLTPRALHLPQCRLAEGLDTHYLYALYYEVYFDTAVVVDTTFYLAGTHHSNILYTGDSIPKGCCLPPEYEYLPTFYLNIEECNYTQCFTCYGEYTRHAGPWPDIEHCSTITREKFAAGPFFPIWTEMPNGGQTPDSLSVPAVDAGFDFSLAPNPATGTVHISTPTAGHHELTVYDNTGRVAMSTAFDGTEATIDISTLAAGIYKAVLIHDGLHHTKTLIKQ